MFCNYCGAQLPDNSRFCNHCGSPLPQVQPPVQNPVQAPVQPQMPPQMQPQMPPRATWPMAQKTEKPEKQSFLRIANILVSVLGLGFLLVFALNFWIAAFGGVSSRELTNGKIIFSTPIPMASFNNMSDNARVASDYVAEKALWPALLFLPAIALMLTALIGIKRPGLKLGLMLGSVAWGVMILVIFM